MDRVQKILVPTDFSEMSKMAVEFAYELAVLHKASLDIVHVFEAPAFPSFYGAGALLLYGQVPDLRKQTVMALEDIAGELRERGEIDVDTHLLDGHAADKICAFAREHESDMIVIPTHGLTGVRHILLGSVAERVIRHAHCPVFVFKTSGPQAGAAGKLKDQENHPHAKTS